MATEVTFKIFIRLKFMYKNCEQKLRIKIDSFFFQVSISGIVKQLMELSHPTLTFMDDKEQLPLKLLNQFDQKLVRIYKNEE